MNASLIWFGRKMEGQTFFHYKPGKSFMHKMPPAIKIILMLILSIAAFYCPLIPSICIISALLIFSFTAIKIRMPELISDLKPALIYAVLMYSASVISNLSELEDKKDFFPCIFIQRQSYVSMMIHFLLSLEITSLFFRTTTSVEFTRGFNQIERKITRNKSTRISDMISLTLNFIPRLSDFWGRIEKAWKARGGKKGIKKIFVLTPVLFKTSMNEAYKKSLAIRNRI